MRLVRVGIVLLVLCLLGSCKLGTDIDTLRERAAGDKQTPSYTVTFNSNGGNSVATQTVNSGGTATRPANPTRSGYTFDNWYSNAGLTTVYNFSTAVTRDITLYAKWNAAQSSKITFSANGGNGTPPSEQTVSSGSSITLPGAGNLTRTGYTFGGWNTNANGTGTNYSAGVSYTPTGDITLYAKWNSSASGTPGYEMVYVPGGSFQMGDTAGGGYVWELPVHTVTMTGFYMGKYEVTQAQYQSVMGTNPSELNGYTDSPNRPVERVSWYDAVEFCNKLSEREGLQPVYTITSATVTVNWSNNGYRLPTEAQWEYAAKGGNDSPGNYTYAGSNNPDEVAWYWENSGGTHEVGTKVPNGLGIYDMSGNVEEWCWDWYEDYPSEAQTNPTGASSWSGGRVLRGGGWDKSAQSVRSANRGSYAPSGRNNDLGFRLVRP